METGDPNDEIPLSVPDGMSYLRNYLPYFGYNLDSDTWLAIQDGKLVYIPTEEGYKEFLRYFTDLYKEGLLDPASFTQNYDQIAAMGSSGDVLGCFSAPASFQFAGRDQDQEYQTLTPFAGQVYPQSTGIMHGSMMITDAVTIRQHWSPGRISFTLRKAENYIGSVWKEIPMWIMGTELVLEYRGTYR